MHMRSSDEISICLSVRLYVRPSLHLSVKIVICDKRKNDVSIFFYIIRKIT